MRCSRSEGKSCFPRCKAAFYFPHALMRRGDDTVARYGGDEFTILVEDVKDPRQSVELAEHVVTELSRPVVFNGLHLNVGISIGLAFYPDDGNDSKELLRVADTAMYSAKAASSGQGNAGRIYGVKGSLFLHPKT